MADISLPNPPAPSLLHRAASGFGLLVLLASALFGGNVAGMRERFLGSETPEERPAAVSRGADGASSPGETPAATEAPKQSVLRSQPWWQSVGKLEGTGTMTAPAFAINSDAVQWRVRWTCQTGQLVVRAPEQRRPVVDAACPGSDTGYGIQKGNVSLQVTAEGPWEMQVDQQVDIPLFEPPLPAMTAPGARPVLTGSLYRIDQVGTGTVTVYRLPDGSHAVRLDDFFVTANSDLELQFSPLEAPRSTKQVTDNPRSPSIATLDVTTGSLNFPVPSHVDPTQYRSFVIWCEVANSAYSASTLRPA
ncbi:MAG: DM13 domain-containing protein [Actinomycetota bacterium]|nr:DM13 domain-containing protein [Actinomycetota bacterium]